MRKPAVLIVDDQSNWRNLFKDLLEDEFEVTLASSFAAAAEALLNSQENPFHVAIIDIRLDDKKSIDEQGLKLAAQLKRVSKHTNIVIVTGYPTIRTVKEAWQGLTAFDYIEKWPESGEPLNHEQFLTVVREAANDSQQRTKSRCDRGKLCDILDDNSTDRDVRKFQQALRRIHDCPEFRNFDALRGPTKWDRIDHLLETWETLDELCRACEIYKTEIRPNNDRLTQALQAICSR